ncbi:MAG: CoA transferase [Pseudonocardia sp.]|uniref:CaiB/BaiF CoA transferase family protein n=1 Tax=unclassified Pseudonocardia TaxID=2619320 RepID=UPI00086A3B54|nr:MULTISPECIES: CoA transferase [unclassified Pseudonocardia]MBN9112210.1 CoA transferase [Pseudonocardia sp.]ODU30146.1 MAG: hypothetical protein ABS80_00650 [Pseudonocardia sp. SCN 72-51]ODV03070.1 MAG: hypothetical protein ABT15_23875 [Pseudonocardia sp. SCN 73-27]
MHSERSPVLPLAGVRVVETTDRAEMCGRFLADLGAEVVKVEPPGGSPTRSRGPFHAGTSLAFAVRNVNKCSVELDPDDEAGRRDLLRLLDTADIWINSRHAVTPGEPPFVADVRARNPRLVVLSVTDFGQTGPYRDATATPWVLTAMSGFLSRSGVGTRYPLMPPAALPAEAAAIQATWAALVGLWNALVTGHGDHIDFSLLEAAGQILDPAMGMSGTASSGAGAGAAIVTQPRSRPIADLYPIFRCADGYVRVVMLSARQWRAMRNWLGDPGELADDALDSIFERFARADLIRRHVDALFADRSTADVCAEGQARGVPCAPVLDVREVLTTPHFLERGAIAPREIAPGLVLTVPTGFVEYDGHRLGIRTPAPDVGEHTAAVLAAAAGPVEVRRPSTPADCGNRPLAGLRVLDLGVIVYGAETGRLFADLGADVIKIENRAHPDGARIARGGTMNANFVAGHRGKRSVGLDLRNDCGRALFLRLVAESDVVLANFKPGTLEALGLDYKALNHVNPGIVLVTSSAMGTSGPWSGWMGYGPLVRCVTGLTDLWRYPDDQVGFSDGNTVYPDHFAARVMATAALAALIARKRSGRGAHVDGAQAETILVQLSELLALESAAPGSVTATGNESGDGAPHGVYPCAGDDEWCVVTVRTDDEWLRFCRATRLTELGADPELRTGPGRLRRRHLIDDRVAGWTATRTPCEVQSLLQAAGVPAGAMLRVTDYGLDPHLVARAYTAEIVQPGLGPVTVESATVRSARIAPPDLRPAPEFGEHTREIAEQLLGLAPAEVDELVAAGVLEVPAPGSG